MGSAPYIINGWDIGGANIKAVQIDCRCMPPRIINNNSCPFEIWRSPDELTLTLKKIAGELGVVENQPHSVTMTAELSDAFQTKREGVIFITEAVERAFMNSPVYLFNLKGDFFSPHEAKMNPLLCVAANWLASGIYTGMFHRDCFLMDIGSTTTDIIPINKGEVRCNGYTDTERLISGELIYSGILRTNPNVISHCVPVNGAWCPVAAEYFTAMADIYLILGDITEHDYTCPTADGKPKNIDAARARLARLICSDSEMLNINEIDNIALFLREKQMEQITGALDQAVARMKSSKGLPLVITGAGAFLGRVIASRSGMPVLDYMDMVQGECEEAALTCVAVAYLFSKKRLE